MALGYSNHGADVPFGAAASHPAIHECIHCCELMLMSLRVESFRLTLNDNEPGPCVENNSTFSLSLSFHLAFDLLSSFSLPPSLFPPLSSFHPLSLCSCPAAQHYQSEGSRPHVPGLDLEQWYQEVMSAGQDGQLCPPPLPTKSLSGRRPLQVTPGFLRSPRFLLVSHCSFPFMSASFQRQVCKHCHGFGGAGV